LAISPSNNYIVSGSWDGKVRTWNPTTGEFDILFDQGQDLPITSVEISPNHKFMVASSYMHEHARVWDFENNRTGPMLLGRLAQISPNNKFIATSYPVTIYQDTIRIWNPQTGASERILQKEGPEWANAVLISPNSQFIVAGYHDEPARIWNAQTGEPGPIILGDLMAISPNSEFIVTKSGPTAQIWDAQTGQEGPVLVGHTDDIISLAISSDNQFIVTGSVDGTARIWNAQTGEPGLIFPGKPKQDINEVAISSDNTFIVLGNSDGNVMIWRLTFARP
jgi:WD40 repeat protein